MCCSSNMKKVHQIKHSMRPQYALTRPDHPHPSIHPTPSPTVCNAVPFVTAPCPLLDPLCSATLNTTIPFCGSAACNSDSDSVRARVGSAAGHAAFIKSRETVQPAHMHTMRTWSHHSPSLSTPWFDCNLVSPQPGRRTLPGSGQPGAAQCTRPHTTPTRTLSAVDWQSPERGSSVHVAWQRSNQCTWPSSSQACALCLETACLGAAGRTRLAPVM
mmetsp:Transcript_16114/g.47874  ORF Transcript_16114/g.47874 Transcript_16114/m.47874 type:complete len:216 (-) Transcript_16114:492-1139(-)